MAGLTNPEIVGESLLLAHRWDLEHWLAVAQMRKHAASGDLAAAARVLQTPRTFQRLGATLDVAGSDELSEQLGNAKEDMGGALSGQFSSLKHNTVCPVSLISVHSGCFRRRVRLTA